MSSENLETQVKSLASDAFTPLTPEQKEQLNKVLFPDTHTDKVKVLGEVRTLTPLPVKITRKLNTVAKPLAKKIEDSSKVRENVDIDEDLLEVLSESVLLLADYYKWDDVKKEVKEEGLRITELEEVLFTQLHLNENNDFLLSPLRSILSVLRITEIVRVRTSQIMPTTLGY